MRIVSKFKDYYDSCVGFGGYGGVQYIRETKRIVLRFTSDYQNGILEQMTIGFCGKMYLCYGKEPLSYLHDYERDYLYDEQQVIDYYESKCQQGKYHYSFRGEREIKQTYEKYRHATKSPYFEQYKCPIFLVRNNYTTREKELILNPCLKTFKFYKVMDAYTTFQEIAMFMSNMASPEKPIPQISNQDMRDAKGFDKYSFRKDKSCK